MEPTQIYAASRIVGTGDAKTANAASSMMLGVSEPQIRCGRHGGHLKITPKLAAFLSGFHYATSAASPSPRTTLTGPAVKGIALQLTESKTVSAITWQTFNRLPALKTQ